MLRFIRSLSRDERGVSALEYAVLAGVVVLAVVAGGQYLSDPTKGIPGVFSTVMANIFNAATSSAAK